MERTNIKQENMDAGQTSIEHSPKPAAGSEVMPAPCGDAATVTTTYPSVSSMYQTAAYKTLAQIRIKKKQGVLLNRRKALGCGYQGSDVDEVSLDALGIKVSYAPVTWREQLLREEGKVKNYCYMASSLRWAWTMTEDEKKRGDI